MFDRHCLDQSSVLFGLFQLQRNRIQRVKSIEKLAGYTPVMLLIHSYGKSPK
jgi:hypothetical protein